MIIGEMSDVFERTIFVSQTGFELVISQTVAFVCVTFLERINHMRKEISPFHVTQNVVVVVISLSENVFDLGVTQIPLFEKLLDLFESVGAVSVLVRQMVHERLLWLYF